MALFRELKFYFTSWVIIIVTFVMVTMYLGWRGFVILWLGFGLISLVMNLRSLGDPEDLLMLVLIGPLGFTTTVSDKLDYPIRKEQAEYEYPDARQRQEFLGFVRLRDGDGLYHLIVERYPYVLWEDVASSLSEEDSHWLCKEATWRARALRY